MNCGSSVTQMLVKNKDKCPKNNHKMIITPFFSRKKKAVHIATF